MEQIKIWCPKCKRSLPDYMFMIRGKLMTKCWKCYNKSSKKAADWKKIAEAKRVNNWKD